MFFHLGGAPMSLFNATIAGSLPKPSRGFKYASRRAVQERGEAL